jgi:hypothetical protein
LFKLMRRAAAVDLHQSLMDRSVSAVQHDQQIAHGIAPIMPTSIGGSPLVTTVARPVARK